jgi:6-phosphogluconolactonase
MMAVTRWHGVAGRADLDARAFAWIADAARAAIGARGEFSIVLAGGNTPLGVYRLLCVIDTVWRCWRIYFGDERCLPPGHPDRNSRMARDGWLDHVPLKPEQIHTIPAERGARAAASSCVQALRGVGDFDFVLLGLGEDGHTASLFPGHDLGDASGAPDVLAVLDAPKPPPERVSLSAARLSRARRVVFLVAGESKRGAVAAWRREAAIPARVIVPPGGVDVLVEKSLLE